MATKKLSELTSVLNGEIPVILVYVESGLPASARVATTEEARDVLTFVEVRKGNKDEKSEKEGGQNAKH